MSSITPVLPSIPDIDFASVDPLHVDLPYEERLLEAMTPRMVALLAVGREAYVSSAAQRGDTGTCGFAWVVIEITPETKSTIRWLREEDCGRMDGWNLNYKVGPADFLEQGDERVQGLDVEEEACNALAAALQQVGIPCRVESRVD